MYKRQSQTTITGTTWPVPSGGYTIAVTLNPGYFGVAGSQEIVYVTGVSSVSGGTNNVATVLRAQEGTSTIGTTSGTNYPWVAGPIASDFDVSNLTSTGTLTLNNGLTVANGVTISGNVTVAGGETVLGSLGVAGNFNVNGTSIVFPNGALQVAGNITTSGTLQAATISGTTVNVGNTLTVGNAINAAGEIYANNTGTAISAPNGNVVVGGNLTVSGNLTVGGVTISGIPSARIGATAPTTLASSGGYATISNMSTGGAIGYLRGGFTTDGSTSLITPIAGYYQINASAGFVNNGGNVSLPGIYGLSLGNTFSNPTHSSAFLLQSGSGGPYQQGPETIVFSDIQYCFAGQSVTLVAYNGSESTYNQQSVGATAFGLAGYQHTYLSMTYIGS